MAENRHRSFVHPFDTLLAIGKKLVGMNTYLFFSLLFVYHVLVGIQGVEILDEGFHITSYQQIFSDPASVQYSMVFWLTSVIGGTVLKLFPFAGLLGLRIAGALVCTSTIIIAYNLLKKHISPGFLKLGLLLLVLFINNDPKDLYYNNLSAFFYLITAWFLYTGLTESRNFYLLLGGVFAGINVFTRIPNLLGLGIGLVVFYYGFCVGQAWKKQFLNFAWCAAGAVIGIAAMIALMNSLGHVEIVLNSLKQFSESSTSATASDGMGGSYGILNIPIKISKQYMGTLVLVLSIASFILAAAYALGRIKKLHRLVRIAIQILIAAIAAFLCYSLIRNGIIGYKLIDLYTGISLAVSFYILFAEKDPGIRLINAIGLFIMLAHPFGSAVGIYTVIPYSMWLVFPFAIWYISKIKYVTIDSKIFQSADQSKVGIWISRQNVRAIKTTGIIVVLLTCFYHIIRYPYFCDWHNRLEMTYSVDHKSMRGIYTSKARAEAINELLEQSPKYVHRNDYVLAYDLIPMFHYWTETRPYIRNPSPWYYPTQVFEKEMNAALIEKKELPVVVMNTILTIGDGSGWPEKLVNEDYSAFERNQGRNKIFTDFLTTYNYKVAWENNVFKILVPGQQKTIAMGTLTGSISKQ